MLHLWLHFSSYIRPSEAKRENTMEPKHWNAWKMIRNKVWYTTEWSFLSASSASRPWKDLDNMDKHSQTTLTSFWFCLTTYPTLLTVSTLWKLTTYPPILENVVCERPLTAYTHHSSFQSFCSELHYNVILILVSLYEKQRWSRIIFSYENCQSFVWKWY